MWLFMQNQRDIAYDVQEGGLNRMLFSQETQISRSARHRSKIANLKE